jgi:hypothetical protein
MKAIFAMSIATLVLGIRAQAPPLAIEPAVVVTFGTASNRLYQVESATGVAPNVWTAVGRSHVGRGAPLNETIRTTIGANEFFRTHEYDWTGKLAAHFPLDGSTIDASEMKNLMVSGAFTAYTADRFESPNAAGLTYDVPEVHYFVRAAVERFAPLTNDFSISLWITGHRLAGPPDRILISTNRLSLIRNSNNALELRVGTNSAPVAVSGPLAWEATQWQCFHVVRARNVFSVYRNAELVAQGESSFAYDIQSPWLINFGPSIGAVDEVRLYNRALPADEVGALTRITRDDPF